jgi:hypothetical protein
VASYSLADAGPVEKCLLPSMGIRSPVQSRRKELNHSIHIKVVRILYLVS